MAPSVRDAIWHGLSRQASNDAYPCLSRRPWEECWTRTSWEMGQREVRGVHFAVISELAFDRSRWITEEEK